MGSWRGHRIMDDGHHFFYVDTGEPVRNNPRPCGHCGLVNTKEGHDGCIGTLPNVTNACCGHGCDSEAYIQYFNKPTIRGQEALNVIKELKKPDHIGPGQ